MKEKTKKNIRSWIYVILTVLFIRAFIVQAFEVPTGSMIKTILPGDFLLVNKFKYGFKLPLSSITIIPNKNPKRGDIIVFRYPVDPDYPQPEENFIRFFPKWFQLLPLYWNKQEGHFTWYAPRDFVKRCIAVAGDTVEIKNKILYINGERQYEPYTIHDDTYTYKPLDDTTDFYNKWKGMKFLKEARVRDYFGPVVVPEGYVFAMGDNRDNSLDSRFWGPVDLKYLKGTPIFIYFSLEGLSPRWERIGHIIH